MSPWVRYPAKPAASFSFVMAPEKWAPVGLLAVSADLLARKCVDGIEADAERAADLVGRNVIIVTALAPKIGYDLAATVAKRATAEGRPVREVALEMEVLPEAELDAALDLRSMTEGGLPE